MVGYADIPLSVFYLSALGYLLCSVESNSKRELIIYAAFLTLVPWIKSEGVILWAVLAVLGIITTWNDYITVAAFAPDVARRTLQVALVNQVFDSIGVTWSYVMSFAIISSIPMVALFIVAQRWFIAGLTAGAVKG